MNTTRISSDNIEPLNNYLRSLLHTVLYAQVAADLFFENSVPIPSEVVVCIVLCHFSCIYSDPRCCVFEGQESMVT